MVSVVRPLSSVRTSARRPSPGVPRLVERLCVDETLGRYDLGVHTSEAHLDTIRVAKYPAPCAADTQVDMAVD